MSQFRRLLNVVRRGKVSQAIDDEFQFHIDERADDLMAQGLNEGEARTRAARSVRTRMRRVTNA